MAEDGRLQEVIDEFRAVVAGRSHVIDAILPPVAFVVLNAALGFAVASWGAMGVAVALGLVRLVRGEPWGYAVGGLAATALALVSALVSDRAEGYFLPNLINGGLTTLICLISVLVGRPLVALTSHLARGWPLAWYWHPKVRPAYSEVTLTWAVFFGLRLAVQWVLFRTAGAASLGLVTVALGWPATILLLVASYLYGTWRLQHLDGPSVEEFEEGTPPPWEGQQRGF